MRIPSGVTDQVIYFIGELSSVRVTGLTNFTVYRSRNGGSSTAMTTPTVTEVDATNMPGVYKLLLDEDMTIGAGNDSEEMVFHITEDADAIDPVTRTIELYRPKYTAGSTLSASAINAEVVDALNVDTYAEPGQGAPAATTSLVAKIGYLYKAWRNKSTQTSTTYILYADDTSTADQKSTDSDDGTTFTKGEVGTGA